jgi:hypothetical protein
MTFNSISLNLDPARCGGVFLGRVVLVCLMRIISLRRFIQGTNEGVFTVVAVLFAVARIVDN